MRKLSLLVVFFSLMGVIRSQDVIYLNDGVSIKAKIVELTTETVKYKKSDQLEGPLRNISLSEVFMIIYEDGTREVFKKDNHQEVLPQRLSEPIPTREPKRITVANNNQDLCFQGQQDALRYYTGYREASTWTGAATILGGAIIGLIPAIACSTTDPQSSTFSVPDRELLRNSTYYQCYSQEARRIKSKKVWTNFGIGVAVNVAVGVLILSAAE